MGIAKVISPTEGKPSDPKHLAVQFLDSFPLIHYVEAPFNDQVRSTNCPLSSKEVPYTAACLTSQPLRPSNDNPTNPSKCLPGAGSQSNAPSFLHRFCLQFDSEIDVLYPDW